VRTKQPRMERALPELLALAAVAGLGSGLAFTLGDLVFAAVLAAAGAVAAIEAIRRSPLF
jgi:hypothetical protein